MLSIELLKTRTLILVRFFPLIDQLEMTPHVTFEWSAYLAVKGGGWDEWISENDWDIYLCNDLEPLPTDIHIPI